MSDLVASKLRISQLQAFVAVAVHSNFSTAALELGLSQSTISHAIASLEDELQVILFARGRHGARLTAIGEQILPDAQQVLQLLGAIEKKANLEKGLQGGQIKVGSVRSVATHILPKVIAKFRQKFPLIQVLIEEFDRYSEVEQALQDDRIHVALTALPTTLDFETWELFRDEFIVLLPPKNAEFPDTLDWQQLASYSMIMNHRNYQHNKLVTDHFAQFGYRLKLDYEVREDSTIIGMVKQGLGATVIARLAAEPIPAEVLVKPLPVPLERVIGVAILKEAILPKAVFVFLDVLKEVWK